MEIEDTIDEALVRDVEWNFSIPTTEKIDDPNKKKPFMVSLEFIQLSLYCLK